MRWSLCNRRYPGSRVARDVDPGGPATGAAALGRAATLKVPVNNRSTSLAWPGRRCANPTRRDS